MTAVEHLLPFAESADFEGYSEWQVNTHTVIGVMVVSNQARVVIAVVLSSSNRYV